MTRARIALACLSFAFAPSPCIALPTPTLTEAEMLNHSDLVIEGRILGVVLTKRWLGDTPSDRGYEQGDFMSWVLITKTLKGPLAPHDTAEVFTHAYAEGKWSDNLPFVYEGTKLAITPGNRVRLYLKWGAPLRRYERVHFNSGYLLLEPSNAPIPSQVGRPALWREAP